MAMNGQRMLTLGDGACVPVRRIRAEDAAALQRLVGRSSGRSVELRFFGPVRELSDEIAGVVRYERERGTDGAEYAALIEDRFQHRGLGIGLTRHLIEAARENGIRHLHALVMRENAEMLGLLRSLDLPERLRWQDGAESVEIDLVS